MSGSIMDEEAQKNYRDLRVIVPGSHVALEKGECQQKYFHNY